MIYLDQPDPREGDPGFEGYCIPLFDGSAWVRADGGWTPDCEERGIWTTHAEAKAVIDSIRERL